MLTLSTSLACMSISYGKIDRSRVMMSTLDIVGLLSIFRGANPFKRCRLVDTF